jgi:hypothetical protein
MHTTTTMSSSQTDTPLAAALRALLAPNQSATDAVQAYKSVASKELTPGTHTVPDLGFAYNVGVEMALLTPSRPWNLQSPARSTPFITQSTMRPTSPT